VIVERYPFLNGMVHNSILVVKYSLYLMKRKEKKRKENKIKN
jgi:hypothetical protein